MKACESLLFLVRDVAHITPENFESAVQCIRTFVEASLGASGQAHHPPSKAVAAKRTADQLRRSKSTSYDANDTETDDLPSSYHEVHLSPFSSNIIFFFLQVNIEIDLLTFEG